MEILIFALAIGAAVIVQSAVPLVLYMFYAVARIPLRDWHNVSNRLRLYQRIRLRHLGLASLTLLGVLAVIIGLFGLPDPVVEVLAWSWLSLAGQDAQNIVVLPLTQGLLPVLYVPLLFLILPYLSWSEERIFRAGTKGPLDALVRSLVFGSVHALVGVPIGAALLALPIGGLVFSWEYLRAERSAYRSLSKETAYEEMPLEPWQEALVRREARADATVASATLHLTYNLIAFSFILLLLSGVMDPLLERL